MAFGILHKEGDTKWSPCLISNGNQKNRCAAIAVRQIPIMGENAAATTKTHLLGQNY